TGGKRLSEYLHAANVRVGTFEFGGYRWSDVRGILQATQAGWRVDVSGAGAAGQVIIPESFSGVQPLRATLDRLVLEKTDPSDAQTGDERDPREIPNLEVYVADLRLGQKTIGAVDLKATRVAQGIRFERATIIGASVRAEGRGEWLITPEGPRSSLQATVTSSDLAATLRDLNYTAFIEGKLGELRGDLTWRGGFEGNILERANGTISVRAEAGQLVALQPGAGRVLGLFSLAALPRRLALDFSDLTEKGLAFDTVHGDFELRDGNAYTRNVLLRGPAAEIGIAGRTGLASRDYDQTAVVTGNLGASLPVAGVLAGGPAVGAALLLFSQVFKEPLKGMTRGYYRITGPWDDPVVERVDAAAVKVSEQKGATGTQ
ncbi:MAG: YhdP family protein, partial [Steroidobacteraceae bacterium]